MDLVVMPSSVEGLLRAPPSKSYTHRALFASLLAGGESRLVDPLVSNDTEATIEAIRLFGAHVTRGRGHFVIASRSLVAPGVINCRGSGTTIRIAAAIASLLDDPVTLYGNRSLNRRPMGPLVEALRRLGASVTCGHGCTPPVTVKGYGLRPKTGSVFVDASISSQFVTALLMIAPLIGLEVHTRGPVRSRPYIDVTARVLEAFGVTVNARGYRSFRVRGSYRPTTYTVPGDYSSASFMLAAGAIAGRVTVRNLDPSDPQADKAILDILRRMGAKVRVGVERVVVEGGGLLDAVEADLSDSPDLAPILAVVAAYAKGVSVLTGLGHLVYKESDRIRSIVGNLRRIGVHASVVDKETIMIKGGEHVEGGTVDPEGDHRIAMAFAIAGLRAKRGVRVAGIECVKDSYPSFIEDLSRIGAAAWLHK